MKWIYPLMVFLFFGCNQQNEKLAAAEIDQIKMLLLSALICMLAI